MIKEGKVFVEDKSGNIIQNTGIEDGDSGKVIGEGDIRAIIKSVLVIVYLAWVILALKLVSPIMKYKYFKRGSNVNRYAGYVILFIGPLFLLYYYYERFFYFVYHDERRINFIYQIVVKIVDAVAPIYK